MASRRVEVQGRARWPDSFEDARNEFGKPKGKCQEFSIGSVSARLRGGIILLRSARMVYGMDKETMRIEWVGQVVDGKFTLLQWLGGSQRGGTFLTELSGPQSQKAAIKLMPAGAIGAEGHVAAWGVTATLAHPHLARLFHTGRCEVNTAPVL